MLASTGPVLLDFDGPVCNVYTGDLNMQAAECLRAILLQDGVGLSEEVEQTRDPLAVLRYAAHVAGAEVVERVERALTRIEVDAVAEAPCTPGAREFLIACTESGRSVVIVSNNAKAGITRFLELHHLYRLVEGVVGRPEGRPNEMKPHPRSVQRALDLLDASASECILVGDSITDVEVARAMGLYTVAFVKAPDRFEPLAAQRPDVLVDDMNQLAKAVSGAF